MFFSETKGMLHRLRGMDSPEIDRYEQKYIDHYTLPNMVIVA